MKLNNSVKLSIFILILAVSFFTVQALSVFSIESGVKTQKNLSNKFDLPSSKTGKDLFFGDKPFKNNGQACIYCHNLKEATSWEREKLGPPLNEAVNDISKAKLIASLVNSHWLVMKTAYKDKPITEIEAIHLVAYLESINNK